MTDTPPITVTADPRMGQLAVALRQVLLGLGPICTLLGLTHLGTFFGLLAVIVGPVAAIVSIFFGQKHEVDSHAKQVALAAATPDQVLVKR